MGFVHQQPSCRKLCRFPALCWEVYHMCEDTPTGLKPARYGETYVTGIGHGVINGVRGNCWIMSGLDSNRTVLVKWAWGMLDRFQWEVAISIHASH